MMAVGKPHCWKESTGPGASNPDTRTPSCRRIAFTCILFRFQGGNGKSLNPNL